MTIRPLCPYFGGKWKIRRWIIGHFPPHKGYLEVCAGVASVLVQKSRSDFEVLNDVNNHTVNFLKVVRDNIDELIKKIQLTPWARQEFENCRIPSEDPIENARRFYVYNCMSMGRGTFDSTSSPIMRRLKYESKIRPYFDNTDHIYEISERFKRVQIDNLDAFKAIEYYDHEDMLIYVDPPYVLSTRTGGQGYEEEWDNQKHIELAERLKQAQGMVIISGYNCELYQELYQGWIRKDKEVNVRKGKTRIESIWIDPKIKSETSIQQTLF